MTTEDKWVDTFRQASNEVSQWRKKQPKATFNDIEKQVDEKLARVRADMIQDLVAASELTDFKRLSANERPKCPVCGKLLASNGQQKRHMVTSHEQVVELERSKGYCAHCRVSYFPPG